MDYTASEQALQGLILQKFDELTELLKGLDDHAANSTLPWCGSNSIVQITVHCCGMMRRWISSVNLGHEVHRDREAEFNVTMPVIEALQIAQETRRDCISDMEVIGMQTAPAHVPEDRKHFWTVTCEGVLLHVLEELSQHLGHAQVTRDVLTRR